MRAVYIMVPCFVTESGGPLICEALWNGLIASSNTALPQQREAFGQDCQLGCANLTKDCSLASPNSLPFLSCKSFFSRL